MGKILAGYFDKAGKVGGVKARIKLATLVKMGSPQSENLPDSQEHIAIFEKAMNSIQAEFSSQTTNPADVYENSRLNKVYNELRQLLESIKTDKAATLKKITETISQAVSVERASIWFYDEKAAAIVCDDLYSAKTKDHTKGTVLKAQDFGAYFQAIKTEKTIAAHDANTDPRTSVFSEPYLKPLGIVSMLDVPIWISGKMYGVVCHEHTGNMRTWQSDEEHFAYMIGSLVASYMEAHLFK
jgi:GAF domain-containing protein